MTDLARSPVIRLRHVVGAWPSWWIAALAVALTAPLTIYWWQLIFAGSVAFDWRIFVEAGERLHAGSPDLYAVGDVYSFRHSPVLAWAMPAVAWIGVLGIRLVTLAAALALPTWPMRLLAVGSWPFVVDLQHGALITLIVLAAAWALTGSRIGSVGVIVLALISPRPLMVPLVVFLLWTQPWLRLPAILLFAAHALAVLATGYADEWIGVLFSAGTDGIESPTNLAPSRFIGRLWIPIGIALAAILVWRGRVGWAALAINPWVWPHYLLLLLLEMAPGRSAEQAAVRNSER
jgi:hypothetical protein